jgi:hypothetical protein
VGVPLGGGVFIVGNPVGNLGTLVGNDITLGIEILGSIVGTIVGTIVGLNELPLNPVDGILTPKYTERENPIKMNGVIIYKKYFLKQFESLLVETVKYGIVFDAIYNIMSYFKFLINSTVGFNILITSPISSGSISMLLSRTNVLITCSYDSSFVNVKEMKNKTSVKSISSKLGSKLPTASPNV